MSEDKEADNMKTLKEHNKNPTYPDFDNDKTGVACDYCSAELRAFDPYVVNLDLEGTIWVYCPEMHKECLENNWHHGAAACSGVRSHKDNSLSVIIGLKDPYFIDNKGNKIYLTKHEQSFLLKTRGTRYILES